MIPQQEHFVAGRVGNGTEFSTTGELIVGKLIAGLASENIAGRDMLTETVENVKFLGGR